MFGKITINGKRYRLERDDDSSSLEGGCLFVVLIILIFAMGWVGGFFKSIPMPNEQKLKDGYFTSEMFEVVRNEIEIREQKFWKDKNYFISQDYLPNYTYLGNNTFDVEGILKVKAITGPGERDIHYRAIVKLSLKRKFITLERTWRIANLDVKLLKPLEYTGRTKYYKTPGFFD